MACDVGTHIDSPAHWFANGRSISDIPIEELACPGAVIDVIAKCNANHDYRLTVEDINEFESKHGKIPKGALVCMKTGWDSKFTNHNAYMGLSEGNPGFHFPGFSVEAAKFLLEERSANSIGIDTASLDYGMAGEFDVHQYWLGQDHWQIENMLLKDVPSGLGMTFVCLPIKIKDAPESETRVMAIL